MTGKLATPTLPGHLPFHVWGRADEANEDIEILSQMGENMAGIKPASDKPRQDRSSGVDGKGMATIRKRKNRSSAFNDETGF